MPQITTDELPEAFQKLLLEVEQTHTPLTVIHKGQPLVIISPAKVIKPRPAPGVLKKDVGMYREVGPRGGAIKPRPAPGVLKGSGEILGDIISPVEQPWEVLQ